MRAPGSLKKVFKRRMDRKKTDFLQVTILFLPHHNINKEKTKSSDSTFYESFSKLTKLYFMQSTPDSG